MVNLSQEIAQKSKVHFLAVPDNQNRSLNLLLNPNHFPKIKFELKHTFSSMLFGENCFL